MHIIENRGSVPRYFAQDCSWNQQNEQNKQFMVSAGHLDHTFFHLSVLFGIFSIMRYCKSKKWCITEPLIFYVVIYILLVLLMPATAVQSNETLVLETCSVVCKSRKHICAQIALPSYSQSTRHSHWNNLRYCINWHRVTNGSWQQNFEIKIFTCGLNTIICDFLGVCLFVCLMLFVCLFFVHFVFGLFVCFLFVLFVLFDCLFICQQ